jgi:hypothetical protein
MTRIQNMQTAVEQPLTPQEQNASHKTNPI